MSILYPRILVIIVTWNKQKYVANLLDSLLRNSYPSEFIDIVVVDNASTDDTVSLLHTRFPDVHVIENSENLGGTGGFNTGLAYAFQQPEEKYEYIWLLDNDVEVHPQTLSALVEILENDTSIGVAGSTMMQLNTPSRINEMGAFIDMGRGSLLLNRHKENVKAFQGKTVSELQAMSGDLSFYLEDCSGACMDVEYVAAASLLIRFPLAKQAGLWDDFFIHYDDVEWCLRIRKMGMRIVVSAKSLIWHISAEYKVPTWVLYYDNRNVLAMLDKHAGTAAVKGAKAYVKKKSVYYFLLGKKDLAALHVQAIHDFEKGKLGKVENRLDPCYFPLQKLRETLLDTQVHRVLFPWTVHLQELGIQEIFVKVMRERPDFTVTYLVAPPTLEKELARQLPSENCLCVPAGRLKRFLFYFRMRNSFDLLFQSDYRPILPLNLVSRTIIYLNLEGMSIRKRPLISLVYAFFKSVYFPKKK